MNEVENQNLFTYHLIKLSFFSALKNVLFPITKTKINGLIHAETMSAMQLGSSVFAPTRLFSKTIVIFAQWENENALDEFLQSNSFGKQLLKSWYLKLKFIRQWGAISHFVIPKTLVDHQMIFTDYDPDNLMTTAFGVKESVSTVSVTPDLIVVPGLAWNLEGYRVGFGGGYYDRYLANFQGETVSLVYDFQMTSEFQPENFDVPISKIFKV